MTYSAASREHVSKMLVSALSRGVAIERGGDCDGYERQHQGEDGKHQTPTEGLAAGEPRRGSGECVHEPLGRHDLVDASGLATRLENREHLIHRSEEQVELSDCCWIWSPIEARERLVTL